MFSWIRVSSASLPYLLLPPLICAFYALPLQAQNSEQVEVGPPPLHRVEPPSPGASAEELERRGDELRVEKNFLDAVDYYQLGNLTGQAAEPSCRAVVLLEGDLHRDATLQDSQAPEGVLIRAGRR